jgi:uncharacterized protein YutE (UPF0331/DUF86 family)
MVNRDLLALKLAELHDRVERVRVNAPSALEELRSDRDALDLVAFNLMLAVQTCSDVASHIIADEGWPVAKTLGDGFARLAEFGVIQLETARALQRAVGLRNVVAHGYAALDVARCFEAAHTGLTELSDFAQQVSRWATHSTIPGS